MRLIMPDKDMTIIGTAFATLIGYLAWLSRKVFNMPIDYPSKNDFKEHKDHNESDHNEIKRTIHARADKLEGLIEKLRKP